MEQEERLALVQFVSRRFNQLQGLRLVIVGLSFTIPFGGYFLLDPRSEDSIYVAYGVLFVLMIPGMLWADRYYGREFGRVTHGVDGARYGLLMGLLFGASMVVERSVLGGSTMIAPFVGNAAFLAWVAIRDWRFQRHHVLGAAAAVAAIAMQLTEAGRAQPSTAIAAGFFLQGLIAVPLGLYDHSLLVSAMKRHDAGEVRDWV